MHYWALSPIKANISLDYTPGSYGYLIPINAIFLITNETLLVHPISVYNHYIKSFLPDVFPLKPCVSHYNISVFPVSHLLDVSGHLVLMSFLLVN